MKIPRSAIAEVVEAVLTTDVKKATRYLDDHTTVKATYQGKRDGRSRQVTVVLTMGRPNYEERSYIKWCKKRKISILTCVFLKYERQQ